MHTITLKAHAKINPSLDVLAKRPDGYHEVRLIMQLIELHDLVILEWNAAEEAAAAKEDGAERLQIRLTCDAAAIPCDESNLAWKAAMLLASSRWLQGWPAAAPTARLSCSAAVRCGRQGSICPPFWKWGRASAQTSPSP